MHRRKGEAVDEALQEWLQLTRQPMTEIRQLLQEYHEKRGTSPSYLNIHAQCAKHVLQVTLPSATCVLHPPLDPEAIGRQGQTCSGPCDPASCKTYAVARLLELGPKAGANIWWPTTQHSLVQGKDVQTIDARSGEHFSVLASDSRGGHFIESRYDGCASWWTQVF